MPVPDDAGAAGEVDQDATGNLRSHRLDRWAENQPFPYPSSDDLMTHRGIAAVAVAAWPLGDAVVVDQEYAAVE